MREGLHLGNLGTIQKLLKDEGGGIEILYHIFLFNFILYVLILLNKKQIK